MATPRPQYSYQQMSLIREPLIVVLNEEL